MGNIITWCNNNQGFVSAIGVVATLMISVVTIIIAIKAIQIPYIKKIKLSLISAFIYDMPGHCCSVSASFEIRNIGMRTVHISQIGMYTNKKNGYYYFSASDINVIEPNTYKSFKVQQSLLDKVIKKAEKDDSRIRGIFAQELSGHIYKSHMSIKLIKKLKEGLTI